MGGSKRGKQGVGGGMGVEGWMEGDLKQCTDYNAQIMECLNWTKSQARNGERGKEERRENELRNPIPKDQGVCDHRLTS